MAQNHSLKESLLSFEVENVRSFRDEAGLSMLATRLADDWAVRNVTWSSNGKTLGLLPVVGIFGANASGKTNFMRAMSDMRFLVVSSFRIGDNDSQIPRSPFLLDTDSKSRPSRFNIDLTVNGIRWQYGFEFDDTTILAEYAFHYPNGRRALVFDRDGDDVAFGPAFRGAGRSIREVNRHNSLLLSAAGAVGKSQLKELYAWFQRNLIMVVPSTRSMVRTGNLMLEDEASRERVLGLLRAADLGISGLSRVPFDDELKEKFRKVITILKDDDDDISDDDIENSFFEDQIRLSHSAEGTSVEFEFEEESHGTRVWLGLLGHILNAVDRGSLLLIDELDGSLHPLLVAEILRIFQDPESNPNNAQLIFNAHDVSLMSRSGDNTLGRDQIYFAEKLNKGATSLYSLSDFSPRKKAVIEEAYLSGRFGAIPILERAEFRRAAKSGTAKTDME